MPDPLYASLGVQSEAARFTILQDPLHMAALATPNVHDHTPWIDLPVPHPFFFPSAHSTIH